MQNTKGTIAKYAVDAIGVYLGGGGRVGASGHVPPHNQKGGGAKVLDAPPYRMKW